MRRRAHAFHTQISFICQPHSEMGVCKVEQQWFVSVTVFAPEMCRSATQSLCEALGDYAHCKVGLDK